MIKTKALLLVVTWIYATCVGIRSQVQTTSGKTDLFKTVDFEIALDLQWKAQTHDTHFEFVDLANMQQIIISVLPAKQSMDKGTMQTAAKEIWRIRQDAINQHSNNKARLENVSTSVSPTEVSMSVFGFDPDNVQIYTIVISHPMRIVSLSFYKYLPFLPDDEFKKRAKAVRSALKVH